MTHATTPTALVWHRTDLRLADNVAVTGAAVAATGSVAGVIVLPVGPHEQLLLSRCGGKMGMSGSADRAAMLGAPPGVVCASPRRMGHLLQAIDELREAWRAQGSALFVLRGHPWECVPALAERLGVQQVHTAPCPAFDERRGNEMTERALATARVKLLVPDSPMIAVQMMGGSRQLFLICTRRELPMAAPSTASIGSPMNDGSHTVAREPCSIMSRMTSGRMWLGNGSHSRLRSAGAASSSSAAFARRSARAWSSSLRTAAASPPR